MDTEGLDSEHSELESVLQDHHTSSLAVSYPKITILPALHNVSPQDHHTPSLAYLTPRSPYSQSRSVSPQDHTP